MVSIAPLRFRVRPVKLPSACVPGGVPGWTSAEATVAPVEPLAVPTVSMSPFNPVTGSKVAEPGVPAAAVLNSLLPS